MKKLFFVCLLPIVFLFLFVGCGVQKAENSDKKLKVVATIFPQYDFIRQIAGDRVEVKMLVPPGVESHMFEPTPKDVAEISKSDLFVYVGGENDCWVKKVLENVHDDKTSVISLFDCVFASDEVQTNFGHGNHESYEDDHVWTSLRNVVKIVEKITQVLCKLDLKNSSEYVKNSGEYIKKLKRLDDEFKGVVSSAKRNVLFFCDRFPFRYFAEDYGLECYSAFYGCSSQADVGFLQVKDIIDKVKDNNIPVVLKLEFGDYNVEKVISEATGAEVRTFYSCHSPSKQDFENKETYLGYMEKNLETLKEALN